MVGMIEGGIKCNISETNSLGNNGTTATRFAFGMISIQFIINSCDNCGIRNCREAEGSKGIMMSNVFLSSSDTIDTVRSSGRRGMHTGIICIGSFGMSNGYTNLGRLLKTESKTYSGKDGSTSTRISQDNSGRTV